jgi:hypothetical protein
LNHNHVACDETGRICATAGISFAIENDWAIAVGWVAENLMEQNGKAVQVSNVKWAKIGMEGIV